MKYVIQILDFYPRSVWYEFQYALDSEAKCEGEIHVT